MRPGRRGLLLAAGLGTTAALVGCADTERTPDRRPDRAGSRRRIRYADRHPDQYGDLALPSAGPPDVLVVLVHGGYWLSSYGLDLMEPIAADLRDHGAATWNLEYRRLGDGGGWPATFTDIAAGIDHVRRLGLPAGLPVILLGHSAGGQLAVWAATRDDRTPGGPPRVRPDRIVTLSGVLDLAHAVARDAGNGAAAALLGGTPDRRPARFALADPVRRVPVSSPVHAFYAQDDQIVPAEESSAFVAADRAAGGSATLERVPGGHFDLIDPAATGWSRIRGAALRPDVAG